MRTSWSKGVAHGVAVLEGKKRAATHVDREKDRVELGYIKLIVRSKA